jgi:phosphopantothenoylcysteine decarboxylase/phosphopantothenate--cysteine ligase
LAIKFTRSSELGARSLKNKRILITAGPTWVPIDSVRVISNTATGETGILLAEKLLQKGAKVTLLLGPAGACCINKKIRLIRFRFFDELESLIKRELKSIKYDAVIHSAAVSDFRPAQPAGGKLASDRTWNLKLLPLPKIVAKIRPLQPKAKLVIFKLESGILDETLIKRARNSLLKYKADLIIANRIHPQYKAFILDKNKVFFKVNSKQKLAGRLIRILNSA